MIRAQTSSPLHPGTALRRRLAPALLALALGTLPLAGAGAQEAPATPAKTEATAPATAAEPKVFRLDRVGTFNDVRMDYTVTAGETFLRNEKDEPVASIFSIAYVRKNVRDPQRRPVTFLFNGGPGSASLWLHMGVFGPKRVDVPSEGENAGAPPYPVVDNPHSILDVTDLVFIDPVGTGYSRVLPAGKEEDYYGVREDGAAVARFIRQWLTENARWNSPKFVGGESYGAVRTAAILREFQQWAAPVSVNGVLLISGAVDMGALDFGRGSDLAYWNFLPTYAATAWYHGRVSDADKTKGFDSFLAEARDFALNRYAPALLWGNRLAPEQRKGVVAELARFTGLTPAYIERANLRISGGRFMKELLRDEGKTIGRFDSRYTGDDFDHAGETPDDDPSAYAIDGAYSASVNAYLIGDLGIRMGREYTILAGLWPKWNWRINDRGREGNLNVAPWIGDALRQNSAMRAFIATGYYDLATPFFAKENAFAANGVPADRLVFAYYPAGHMMYVHRPSLEQLAKDVRGFVLQAIPATN